MKVLNVLGVILVSGFILIFGTIMYGRIYNNIVGSFQKVNEELSNLDTQYQRRYALIRNLIEIVKETKDFEKYIMNFEKEIYSRVAEAKASATKMNLSIPENIQKRIQKEGNISNLLVNFIDKIAVLAQQYPQITDPSIKEHNKTIDSLNSLRSEIKDLEQEILTQRQILNACVKHYNINISIFPANVISKNHSFQLLPYFEIIDKEAKEDVKIKF